VSFIPWTDDPTRPTILPFPGEPIDFATAATLLDWYQPEITAALDRSVQDIRRRHKDDAITVRIWTAAEVVTHWSPMVAH
jgi:hypothetical protein